MCARLISRITVIFLFLNVISISEDIILTYFMDEFLSEIEY